MNAQFERFAEALALRLIAIGELIETHILAQMLSGGDTFCSSRFEIDRATIRTLASVLQADTPLWADVQRAVQAHRKVTHWSMLVEHVYTVGNLRGGLKMLESAMSCPDPEDRRRLAVRVNCLDWEIALCNGLADRRDLAARVNHAVGYPLIDGLTFRAFTYVLGEHADLCAEFRSLVEQPSCALDVRHPYNKVGP